MQRKAKKYLFKVSSKFNEDDHTYTKRWVMVNDKKNKTICEVAEVINTEFKPYTMAIEFIDDRSATKWFNSHYKGF